MSDAQQQQQEATVPSSSSAAAAEGEEVSPTEGTPSLNGHPVAAAGSPSSPGPADASAAPGEPSLEELQEQLQQMEAEQEALAAELNETTASAPQLDQHLAVIEEQFRESFDERFRANAPRVAKPHLWEDQTDVLRTNRIFREASRLMGDEWGPVFRDLMAPFPPEVLDEELAMLDQQPDIIRGYKALMAWKEVAGQGFTIMKLVDSLRKNDMDDIADVTINILDENDRNGAKKDKSSGSKPVQRRKSDLSSKSKTAFLDNRQMLLLAKKIGGDYEGIGKALALPEEELAEIKEDEGATYQGAFKILWAWRQTQPPGAESEATLDILKNAFREAGKEHLVEHVQPENK